MPVKDRIIVDFPDPAIEYVLEIATKGGQP